MRKLYLVLCNIRTLLQKDRIIIILFVIGIMASGATMLYSFGQVYSLADYISDEQSYTLIFQDGYSFAECRKSIEKGAKEISEIKNIKIVLQEDLYSQTSLFAMYKSWDYAIQYGESFDETDEPQIIIGTVSGIYGNIGETVEVNNVEYRIVGKRIYQFINQVNYASIDDDMQLCKLEILLHGNNSVSKINKLKEEIATLFPEAEIISPEPVKYLSYFLSNKQFYIALALSFLSIMNLMQLYRYLLNKRRNMYAVYQICGCNKKQGSWLFLIEINILTIIPYLFSMIIYKLILEHFLKDDFFYNITLSARQIFVISVIFLFLQLLIFVPMLKKYSQMTPKQLKYAYEAGY